METTVIIHTSQELSLSELCDMLYDAIRTEHIPEFIAKLDAACENWEVTESIIKHFKAVEIEYLEIFDEKDRADLSPLKIPTE